MWDDYKELKQHLPTRTACKRCIWFMMNTDLPLPVCYVCAGTRLDLPVSPMELL